ncbi:hypothetical protein PFISCL1PPCAC_12114, partial [Pristionchus fissidentatus]
SIAFVHDGSVYIWERVNGRNNYDHYHLEIREEGGYLHRAQLKSDGFHWSSIATTGQIPEGQLNFSVYDSQECRLYMEEYNEEFSQPIFMLDLTLLKWQKLDETHENAKVANARTQAPYFGDIHLICARKLHIIRRKIIYDSCRLSLGIRLR